MKTLHTIYTNFAKRLALILTLLLTLGVTTAWAAEETATLNSTCFKSNADNYQETEGTIKDTSGGEWKVKGYGMVQNTSVTLGKGNANYLQTPNFSGNISKIKVTCSGSYYLQITDNNGNVVCEQQKVNNSPLTFNISGDYSQLKLFSKRFESTSNAATTITEVVVTYNTTPACKYTVQFEPNGGTGTMSDQTFICDVEQQLTANSFSRTGYTFTGWNTKDDGSGDSYTNQQSVNLSSTNNDNITLYAQWTPTQYTITYNGLEGATHSNPTNYTIESETITFTAPSERIGYNFTGWNPASIAKGSTGNKTVTAQWTEKALTNYRTSCTTQTLVSLHPNGGTISDANWKLENGVYKLTTEDESITLPTITRDGYTFSHWDTQADDSGIDYDPGDNIDLDGTDVNLYAQWTCETPVFDIKIKDDNPVVFSGESIELTVVGSNIVADATYQWYKKNGENYGELAGETTDKLTIAEATVNDAGNYKCKVTNGTCFAENDYTVKMYRLRGLTDPEDNWTTDFVFAKGENKTATYSTTLNGNSSYLFKVHDGSVYYGNTGANPIMTSDNCTGWTMQESTGHNVTLQTTITGTYIFTLDYTDASNPTISVTYPQKKMVYLNPNDIWNQNEGEVYTVYSWIDGGSGSFVEMTSVEGCGNTNIYQAEIDASHNKLLFIRWNQVHTSWNDSRWNQSIDLTYQTNGQYKIDDWGNSSDIYWKNGAQSSWASFETTFTPNHTVTFNANGHGTEPEDQCITDGEKASQPTAPTATGYTFGGWYKEAGCTNAWDFANDVVTEDITLFAKWTANTNTAYTVKHYQENIDGTYPTTPSEIENLTGTTATSVTPAVKDYPGFKAPSTQTVTIAADGSTVVEYKYTRNSYTLTWNLAGGEITEAGTTAGSVKFGASLTAPTVTKSGLTFIGWSPEVPATMPAEDITYTAIWANCIWVETTTIEDGDEIVFIMVDNTTSTSYAMDNKVTTSSNPLAIEINTDIFSSGNVPNNIIWDIQKDANGIVFYSKTAAESYLRCNAKPNVRVGVGANNTFTLDNGYIQSLSYDDSYLAVATGATTKDWRQYGSSSNNITNQTLKFYKRVCLPEGQYRVTWDANGGAWSDGSTTKEEIYTGGDPINLPEEPELDGYKFDSWEPTPTIMPENNTTFTAKWKKLHTITWNIAGDETLKTTVANGDPVELPNPDEDPTSCSETYTTFVGWYTAASGMETSPSVEPQGEQVTTSTVPTGNATYYAVWADAGEAADVIDVLNRALTGITETSYSDWSGKTSNSDAVYAGQSAGGHESIQLRSNNNNSGIITTASGGKATKVVVTWNENTTSGRTLNIYGKNSAYEAATDLYDNSKSGTLLGTIVCGTSTELTIDGDYEYIGMRSASGAMYLDEIQITWSAGSEPTGYISSCCQSPAVVTVTPADANLELNIDGTASTTVNISQTGSTSGTFSASVNGSATLEATNNATDNPYTLSFTATEVGEYIINGTFTDDAYDCPKYGSATINVVANPILQVSEPTNILSECGTDGTPVAVTIDSRYLTGSSLTAQIATTTDTEHGTFKICATENGTFATTDLTGLPAGQDGKASVTIYVRYDAAVDNIDAATGTLTITDGTTSQTIDLATTPICGTSIRMTPTDANSVRVTTANGQWTRTKTPIHLSGSYLLQNLTGDQGAKVELTSSNSNFKFVKPDVGSSGTVKYESEKITNNTWEADVYLVYTPTTYNANETTTITAKVITFGGTTEHAAATMIAYGRSFPETFVLALNTGSEWVALPADMIAPYGTGCTTGVGNHDPYPITVDDNANPTAATLAPTRAIYKGAARNTPMTNPWTIQFESNTQAGYYLFGSVYNDAANTSIANLAQATGEGLKWELTTEDNITYRLSQMSAPAFQLGYNATANYMGQYQSTATNFKYDFRILPVEETCTYYIEPVMTLVDYTDDEAKVRIQYDGTNLYQISMDNKANWTNITGEIDCKDLTFTLPNTTYRDQNIWLKPQGDLCEEVVSSVACHIPAPVINHPGNQNFIGTANQLFSGTFTITGNDLYKDVSAINITTNSNPAIGATISNGTITITMAPSPVGTYTTNITFDAVGAEEVTVKVTIEITSGRVITWMANGIEYEKTEVGEGASPVLPTEPSPDDYACGTKEFVGWTTIAEITDGFEPDPLITDASQITNDMDTLYAVFADCITNHKPKDEYVLVTDINKLKAGDKIIFAYTPSEYVAGDFLYDSSNDLSVDGTATFSKTQPLVIPSTETLIFTLGGSAGAWTFTTLDGRKLGAEAEKELSLTTEGSGITTWNIHSISTTNGDADIEPSTTTTYGKLTYISVFSLYKETSSPKKPQIYKRVVGEEDIDDVPKHRIQLSVLRTITYNEEVREDISFVLPASVGSVGCDGKVFVGWTTTADLTSTSEPADFYDKGVSVLVTEPKTYYAVFATESKNASTSNITLDYSTLGITGSYTQREPTVSGYTFVVTGYRNSTDYFQMKRSEGDGILYNKTPIPNMKSIKVTISESTKEYAIYENDVFNDYEDYGNPITPEGTTGTATANVNAGNEYFTLKVEEDGTVNISSVVIEYYPTTYSDYTTDCIAITKYNVTHTLTGVESSSNNPTIVTDTDTDLWLEYTTQTGYTFPEEISITMGGYALSISEYEWENGALYIEPANGFTGDVNITITAEQSTDVFTKVTSAPADWSGEYLIVYDAGNVALDGSSILTTDGEKFAVARKDDDEIYADTKTKESYFTIEIKGDYYAIKSAGGKYIGQNDNSNGLDVYGTYSDNYYKNSISFDANGNVVIIGAGGAYLRYNDTNSQFRYYKSSTYTNQKAISLYKRNTSASPLPARKSNVSAHASNAASKAYISPAARLSNAECIGYQNFTTQCSNVYVEEWDVDKIYIEAVEGMSSVELHSKKNSNYTHIATTTASRNADGTYTITATNGTTDLSDIACEKMRISIKDASNNVIAAQLYKVPIIVENAIKTNDNWFVTTLGASTCANCDLIIRDNAVLEHVAGGVNDFRNLTIYESAALRNEQTILSVEDLLIRSKRDDVGYAIIEKDNGFISANTVAHTKRIDAAYWYTFALPYDCKIADITQANGKSMGEYGKDWGIKYYDGQARQASGTTAGQGNSSQFWEPMLANGVLEANHGYIIALFDASVQDDNEMRTIYFPPAENKEYTESGTGSKATTIVNWTDNLECDQQHHGWNFTSTPYISIFNPSEMADNDDGAGMNASNVLMTGKINLVDGSYYEETLEDVYVSIPSTQGAKYYDQQLASSTSLMPFSAYFVQAVDPETGNSETKTLTYAKGARTLPTSAPARAAATKQRVLVELKTTAPDGQTDNTGVWVDERYTTNYEIAADLTKMYATGTKPQLYTWANNQRMAYNALPDNAATYVPLGLYAPVAGNYLIAINQRVSRLQGAESVELLYNNAVVANLLVQDYILTANQGENSGYALRVHRKAQVSTAIDNISGSTITLIANDGYISLTGVPTDAKVNIYDMLGRLIATQNTNGQTVINMPMIPQGVYNIVINSTNGHQTMKTIIR